MYNIYCSPQSFAKCYNLKYPVASKYNVRYKCTCLSVELYFNYGMSGVVLGEGQIRLIMNYDYDPLEFYIAKII